MLWARCRSRGSEGVWNAGRATREHYGVNFTGNEQGGGKRLFTRIRMASFQHPLRSRTKSPKGRMFKTFIDVACYRENTLSLSLSSSCCGAGVKPYGKE